MHACLWLHLTGSLIVALATPILAYEDEDEESTPYRLDEYDDDEDDYSKPRIDTDIGMGEEQEMGHDESLESDYYKRLEETQGYLDWYAKEWIVKQNEISPSMATCKNLQEYCVYWAVAGHCSRAGARADYMQEKCAPACFACHERQDEADEEEDEDRDDEDSEDEIPMSIDTGVKQEMGHDPSLESKYHERLRMTQQYFQYLAEHPDPAKAALLPMCKNQNPYCSFWAAAGHCDGERFTKKMMVQCAPACFACDYMLYENRCPMDNLGPNAWKPGGDLDAFFEKLTTDAKYKSFEPLVWSRPTYLEGDTEDTASYKIGPWVVSLENVLSAREADRLIELGALEGYERSDDWGEYLEDGTYQTYYHEGRTSHHAWCFDCYDDPVARGVLDRIEFLTGISSDNYENLQLLRYEEGQLYKNHHDYDDFEVDRQQGVRILTFFLYLNTVEEGGGTNFPHLDLTFTPKRGRAVIWPNVLNEDPDKWDERTEHQALPPIKGTKYAANAWIHQRDCQGPLARDCKE